ncbi:DUF3597 domain-containing protein [Sphingomonas sp. DT-207]|uniref:DUF3597 domain-containing protein n=1 Tax=Sphingomonas sp. DT-207 TaxID=3396167 RepID=UPI003F1B0CC1
MGIFSKIKSAIFGAPKPQAPQPTPQPAGTPAQAPAAQAPAPQPQPQPQQPVDVEQVLEGIAAGKGNPDLNWRQSIVDLLKLLDIDSSLDARKELAEELGYTGARDGSAEMNIWLHKQVMNQLEANGGKVPASLKD